MIMSKHMGDIQTYKRHPNICGGVQRYGAIQTHRGHPNIQGASKHMGASKCIGAYGHPLSLIKYAFLCCVCTGGIQTSSKQTGSIQTYVGVSKHMGASKNMGASKLTGAFPHAFLSREAGFATSFYLCMDVPYILPS